MQELADGIVGFSASSSMLESPEFVVQKKATQQCVEWESEPMLSEEWELHPDDEWVVGLWDEGAHLSKM
ncbi:MAG: hypothetical protein EP343_12535 [Deltaproteobacteria bacterium]|nr:MAG: hypothetical protein EP343_12535 [Deltaproteobacteria bacterium]